MINEFSLTKNCGSKIFTLVLEPIKVSGGRNPRSPNLCSSCLMRPRSQWVYKTVKIYIYILHVTEFAKYIMPFPVPDSIYAVRHILAFGVKRIFCSRHLQEGRFVNHKTLTTQASGFYHIVSVFWFHIKTFLFTLLHDIMQAPSPMLHCRACITTAFSKVPEKIKRNTHN